MLTNMLNRGKRFVDSTIQAIRNCVARWTKPVKHSFARGAATDLLRSKSELVIENALLRQQLIVLQRTAKRPRFTRADRALMVLLASKVWARKDALLIVRPETVLRWHQQGFRLVWKRKSKATARAPKIPAETVALIEDMATTNRLWGAERIRGELLKLGIYVSKRTIQTYMRQARPPRPGDQTWPTFLRNHASEIWACDFVQSTDLFFRPLFAFFITELASRRVVHVGVTRSSSDAWVAQQLREATPFGAAPNYLICDNDGKFGQRFAKIAAGSRIKILRTPYQAPRANAVCERFLGSVRRECLDYLLILSEAHLRRVLTEYVAYFNRARPHQGIRQRIPERRESSGASHDTDGRVITLPVLGGSHHVYCRAA